MASVRRVTIGWGALFGLLCVAAIVLGLEPALHFDGPAIDGPFQLYNALRRIANGQRVGVDFEFFHGALIPYLHYPFFRLFGGGFFASEITRQLLSAALYPLTVVLLLKTFLRDWTRTLAWSAAVMALSIGLRMTSVVIAVNSLLGVRSTLPMLLPIVLYKPTARRTRVALGALVLGGALLSGTEQGLALILAIVLTTIVLATRRASASVSPAERARARRESIADGAMIVGGGVLVLLTGLLVLGGVTGLRNALRYNFTLVPMDQYWFFGAPPNVFVSSWGALPGLLITRTRILVTLVLGLIAAGVDVAVVARGRREATLRRDSALLLLVFYGLISTASLLGTWAPVYVQPLMRVLLVVGAILLAEFLDARRAMGRREPSGPMPRSATLAVAACVLIMFVAIPQVVGTMTITLAHMLRDHLTGKQPAAYAAIWPETLREGQAILEANRRPDRSLPTLWSTYAGLLEARNGVFNPAPDYIIHALGPELRAKYVADFTRLAPDLVQTVDPLYTRYEWWIESTSWDFYAKLLADYDVTAHTPWSLFWKRRTVPDTSTTSTWQSDVARNATGIRIPPITTADSITLLQVEVTYEISNPLRHLPVIGTMPRYLVSATNAVAEPATTLDPYVTVSRFPLLALRGVAPELHWATFGLLPGASIHITRVRASVIPVSEANRVWLRGLATDPSTHPHF